MNASNRVAIVTGASRGLGEVIARVLAGRGYDLVVNARNTGPLQEGAESLGTYGSRVVPVAGDVTDASSGSPRGPSTRFFRRNAMGFSCCRRSIG